MLIVEWCHKRVCHGGRGLTINEVRDNGFWIPNLNSLTRHVIWKCIKCRTQRGKVGVQQMSPLPEDRVNEAAPFTYCGVDLFGPILIKERRSEVKRYGVIFTCLACRGIHLESNNSLETDSFIQALRRFIARRGNVRTIRSDNGTNFVGADNEFKRAFNELDREKIDTFLNDNGCDAIEWRRNPPYASHFGGVWERHIRTVRSILVDLLKTHGHSINDENLRTLLCEIEAVVNSRPLTVTTLSDPESLMPISPSNLLTTKTRVIAPPPGAFDAVDVYSRRRWRRIQHITNEFWSRWRKELLATLQEKSKWWKSRRNFRVGDIVLLADGT